MSRPKPPKGEATYVVGRGRPPKHSQFKPGQSGNAGGRKKGVPNLRTIVSEVMTRPIELTENGRKRKATMLEAAVLRLAALALEGNSRALTNLLDLCARHAEPESARQTELAQEDHAILETFREAMLGHDQGGPTNTPDKPKNLPKSRRPSANRRRGGPIDG
jgi:hypothetical protein